MRRLAALSGSLVAAAVIAGSVNAAEPVRNDAKEVAKSPMVGGSTQAMADARRSGFDFMTPQVQAMQRDDSLNPAMLWVQEGQAMWDRPEGKAARSCASCHGDAAVAMRGVAARYPAFDKALKRAVDLRQRIDICRVEHQQAAPLETESQEQLSLESFVAMQSRGMPIAPPADDRLRLARDRGERLFTQRIGQLDFSCAQCHDDPAGQHLAGSTIPQAHPTGYPEYRLEWQGMGSLQRRLRSCMSGVRAEPFSYGAQELVELEAYLAQRAAGLQVDSPAVRP
jgi:sulfur-oxidizing protein SoxA